MPLLESTGQSQWEPPAPVAVQPVVPQPDIQQHGQQQMQQQAQQSLMPQQQLQQQPEPTSASTVVEHAAEIAQPAASIGSVSGAPVSLQAMLDAIAGKAAGGDKRQVPMIKASIAALHKQAGDNAISPETMAKLDNLVFLLQGM